MATNAEPVRRADARRNREVLLESATRLFAEDGDTTVRDVARDAGVGVGTLYRHFPTREALIEAAYRKELDAVCDAAVDLQAQLPPEEALRAWMQRFLDYMTTKIGMADALRAVISSGADPYAHSRDRLDAALGTLLSSAAAAGATREGIPADDVLLSLSGIALAAGRPEQREQALRMLELLIAGLRRRP
jgi:AcrR family transcriptional regulator